MIEYQNIGTHGLAGLIGALLSWLGFRDRLNRHDDRLADLERQVAALDAGRTATSETARSLAALKTQVVYSREWEHCRQQSDARAAATTNRLDHMDANITREAEETREEIRDLTKLVNQLLQRRE